MKDGVGGMAKRGTVLFAGVMIERPRLLNFRRGGVSGFTKFDGANPVGPEIFCGSGAGEELRDNARGAKGRLSVFVLTARFLRFRGFFPGVMGLCISKNVPCVGFIFIRSGGWKIL